MDKINNLFLSGYFVFLIIISLIIGPAIPDLIMTLSSLLGLIFLFINKVKLPKENLFFLLLSFIIILFTVFFSENFKVSFPEFIVDLRYFLYLFLFLIFFQEKLFKYFILFLFFIILFLFFDLLIQYNFGKDIFGIKADMQVNRQRLNGPFNDEYIVGTYILKLSLPVIGYYLFYNKKLLFQIVLATSFIAIILSGERMALILYVFGVSLIFIFLKKYKILILTSMSLIVAMMILFIFFPEKQFKYLEFIHALLDFRNSGHGAHFLTAFYMFLEYPITGAGFKMFRELCNDPSIVSNFVTNAETCTTHPHNIYLEILAECGAIGLFGFLTLIYFFSKRIYDLKLYKSEYVGFVAIFICIFWPISSMGNFFNNWNACINFSLIGFLLIKKTEKPWKVFYLKE